MDLQRDHAFNPFNPSSEHQAILDVFSASALDDDPGSFDYGDPAALAALMGMPTPPTMKPAALQQRAREMATDIFNDYGTLQAIYQHRRPSRGFVRSWLTWGATNSKPP